jgi:hypothetical protein
MTKHKPRIIIKDLPENILISDAEKKKIMGGAPGYANMGSYMNYSNAICPIYKGWPPRKY